MVASTVPTSDAPARPQRLPLLVLFGLLAGPFLSSLDTEIVNVALPAIARTLHADIATTQWIISGYLLALAIALPGSAYLAKRFGTRRVYVLSLIAFTLASLTCAFAPTLLALIVTRALQGLFGAPLVPLAMNMLIGNRDPQGQRQHIPAAAGMLVFLAPTLGPTIGGLLLRIGDWPLIFLVNIPFGLVGILGAIRIDADRAGSADRSVRFDPLGLLLVGSGLALAIYGATEGAARGWLLPGVMPYWIAGLVLLFIYLIYATLHPHPVLAITLLRHGQSALANSIAAITAIVMFSVLLLVPIYLQQLQGASPLLSGFVLLPQGLITGVGTVLGSLLPRRFGLRATVVFGMCFLAASTALMLLLDLTTPAWVTALMLSGRGLAIGLTIQPLLLSMLGRLDQREMADGNTLFNVTQRLGGSLGIALLATYFAQREAQHVNDTLHALGLPASVLSGTGNPGRNVPPVVLHHVGEAAIAGLHDTVLVLVALALFGSLLALFVQDKTTGSAR